MKIFTIQWVRAAGMRAIKTMAQTALASIGTTQATLGDINWVMVMSTSVVAGIVSVLTSLAGLPELKTG